MSIEVSELVLFSCNFSPLDSLELERGEGRDKSG
jgi:hypothetical protein